MRFLLDANVVSHFGRRHPNRNVVQWLERQAERDLALSAITLRELWYGAEKARLSRHAEAGNLAAQVSAIGRVYADRVLPIDASVARAWASMLARSHKHVDETGLAATAAVHGPSKVAWAYPRNLAQSPDKAKQDRVGQRTRYCLVLVTRNVSHLRGRGVPLLDPFTSPAALIAPAT